MKVKIITLFPQVFPGPLGIGVIGRAIRHQKWELEIVDLKKYSIKNRVDNTPYGGGAGMVITPVVLGNCLDNIIKAFPNLEKTKLKYNPQNTKLIYMSPRGVPLTSKIAQNLSQFENLIIICGRYEGIDERVIKHYKVEEISIGNYILSGGEVAAMALLEATIRYIPGVINAESLKTESFSDNLLEYPHYTKPYIWKNQKVPSVLLSGNHAKINRWRLLKSKLITKKFLLKTSHFTKLFPNINEDLTS